MILQFNKSNFCVVPAIAGTLFFFTSCKKDTAVLINEAEISSEYFSGGETTVFNNGSTAFEQPSTNCNETELNMHADGDAAFEATFVTAPAAIGSGLGPIFNQTACNSCHPRNGRSAAPDNGTDLKGLLFRLSQNGVDANGGPMPLTGFGGQLQTKSIFGYQPEAKVNLSYIDQIQQFINGETYTLRQPLYSFYDSYIPMPAAYNYSPRIAPPVFGLGLLEAVSEAEILSFADVNDLNGDGISGKPNYVWDHITQQNKLGRFGWKASEPTLYQQSAKAYNGDMGITSPYFSLENSYGQPQNDTLTDDPEVDDNTVMLTAFYTQTLAVPARRNVEDETVIRGKNIFKAANCNGCHRMQMQTGTNPAVPSVNNQTIRPFTDMLLHDMGPALADNMPVFNANGQEWRTPPLWGIGLTKVVNGHTNFLHDGRARSIIEAIMWHGGEAEASKNYVKNLSKEDREALIKFLESL
jgi:CxxC motif-containing protein (DUF1111 family)